MLYVLKIFPHVCCRQYAQRSRVRKLQYIAELERKVQALQVRLLQPFFPLLSLQHSNSIFDTDFFFWTIQSEGIDVSAEMEFLSQQNIMLDLENKALKQRLESLAQEQLIKRCKYAPFWFGVPTLLFLSALKC